VSETMTDDATTRIINFTDAVVAIAATLLILEPIAAAAEAGDRPLPDVLSSTSDQLLAFAVSFAVIGHFWLLHRRLFRSVRQITQPMYWFNLLWLFSIVFLPYPTALLSGRTEDSLTCALYIGTMTLTSMAALALKILVARANAEAGESEHSSHLAASVAAVAPHGGAATTLALLVSWVELWGLLLLVPTLSISRHQSKDTSAEQGAGVPQERLDA
jgi:uncharacterized membrane protein